jgi:hypothetical protein
MTEAGSGIGNFGPSNRLKYPFFRLGIEIVDVFLPLMDSNCLSVYAYLKRKEYSNPNLTHSTLDVAAAIGLGKSTVARSLEILKHLKLTRLFRFAGNRDSECKLLDSAEAAFHLGATYSRATLSFSLPLREAKRIETEIKAIRERQQGKSRHRSPKNVIADACGNRRPRVSQRNARVSLERRELPTRDTQTETHLLQEEVRNEEIPTPTPTPTDHSQSEKDDIDSPNEDERDPPLQSVRAKFIGVMKDMGNHLLDTSKPPAPYLANGAGEWEKFGFDSLAVEAATWRGEVLALVLSASDPSAAQSGLEKYRKTWEANLRKWYKSEVHVELQQAQRKW